MESPIADTTAQSFNWVNFICLVFLLLERAFKWFMHYKSSSCWVQVCGSCFKAATDFEKKSGLENVLVEAIDHEFHGKDDNNKEKENEEPSEEDPPEEPKTTKKKSGHFHLFHPH